MKQVATKTSQQVTFDIHKALKVIESNKILKELFSNGEKQLSFKLLHTMASNGTISAQKVADAKEIFEKSILKSTALLEQYNNLSESKPDQLPKHYGKKRVLQDIQASENKTELDRAMLALNNMKNLYAKLKRRAISDKLRGTKNLTIADCRTIIAMVRTMENKAEEIL